MGIVALVLAGLQFQEAVRLHRQTTLDRTHHNIDNRSEYRQVDNIEGHLGQLLSYKDGNVGSQLCHGSAKGVLGLEQLIFHIGTGGKTQVIAGLDRHVLALDGDVTVRGADADARKGVDAHITPWGGYIHRTVVGGSGNLVDTIFIGQFETATQSWTILDHGVIEFTHLRNKASDCTPSGEEHAGQE